MPRDPIVAIRQQKRAYEAQQASASIEAVKRMAMDRVIQSAPQGFIDRASDQQLQAAVDAEAKMIVAERAAQSGKPPVEDPSALPPGIRKANIMELGRVGASNILGALDKMGGGPVDLPDAVGLGVFKDLSRGQAPRLDNIGDLLSIGSSAAGAAIPQMRAARVGTTLGKSTLQSLGGSALGAGLAGTVQQHLEKAQDLRDTADRLQEAVPGYYDAVMRSDVDGYAMAVRGLQEAVAEAGTSGFMAFSPNMAKAAFAKFADIATPEADRLIRLASRYKIDLGIQDVAASPIVSRARDILGKFPVFGGSAFNSAAGRQAKQMSSALPLSFGNGLAPTVTRVMEASHDKRQAMILKANLDVFNRLEKGFSQAIGKVNAAYTDFRSEARKAGATVGQVNASFAAMVERRKIRVLPKENGKAGEPLGELARVDAVLDGVMKMEDSPSLEAFINKGKQIESLISEFPPGSQAAGILIRVKQAMEKDIQLNLNAPTQILQMRDAADAEYKALHDLLSGQAARRMRRIDKTFGTIQSQELMVDADGNIDVRNPGTFSPEKLIDSMLNSDDPGVVRNLESLLKQGDRQAGHEAFKNAVAMNLSSKIMSAETRLKNSEIPIISSDSLRKSLGLDNRMSDRYKTHRLMFERAGSKIEDLSEVLDLADKLFQGGVPNVSQFITRRALLGGAASALRSFSPLAPKGRGVETAGSTFIAGIASTAATQILLKKSGMNLTDPLVLRNLKILLDPKRSYSMRMQSVHRLVMYDAAFLSFDSLIQDRVDKAQNFVSQKSGDLVRFANEASRNLGALPTTINQPLPAGAGGVR